MNGPRTPSTGPGSKPCARSATCNAATRALPAKASGASPRAPTDSATPTTAKRRMTAPSRPRLPLLPSREGANPTATIRPLPSPVAQLAEHPAVNRRVVSSSPTRGAAKACYGTHSSGPPFRGAQVSTQLSTPEEVFVVKLDELTNERRSLPPALLRVPQPCVKPLSARRIPRLETKGLEPVFVRIVRSWGGP